MKFLVFPVNKGRFGKSTHIFMISNSVTHLRSYTNSAIAENSAPILPVSPHDRRHLHIERRYRHIEWQVFECFMLFHNVLRVFHDVLLVVHDVLLVVHDVSQCFTCVSWCFTMFNNVLWSLASRATIGVAALATAQPLMASLIATTLQVSAITPQGLAITPHGSLISPRTWSQAKLCPEWRLE